MARPAVRSDTQWTWLNVTPASGPTPVGRFEASSCLAETEAGPLLYVFGGQPTSHFFLGKPVTVLEGEALADLWVFSLLDQNWTQVSLSFAFGP